MSSETGRAEGLAEVDAACTGWQLESTLEHSRRASPLVDPLGVLPLMTMGPETQRQAGVRAGAGRASTPLPGALTIRPHRWRLVVTHAAVRGAGRTSCRGDLEERHTGVHGAPGTLGALRPPAALARPVGGAPAAPCGFPGSPWTPPAALFAPLRTLVLPRATLRGPGGTPCGGALGTCPAPGAAPWPLSPLFAPWGPLCTGLPPLRSPGNAPAAPCGPNRAERSTPEGVVPVRSPARSPGLAGSSGLTQQRKYDAGGRARAGSLCTPPPWRWSCPRSQDHPPSTTVGPLLGGESPRPG